MLRRISNALMRFLAINEIDEWCTELGIELDQQARPLLDPSFSHCARLPYAEGGRSGREADLARVAAQRVGDWDEALLWVTQTGVWPSTEDWPAYYSMRGQLGERRSLEVAPGHLFTRQDATALGRFLTATMENGWDAFVVAKRGNRVGDVVVEISHDEWIGLRSTKPVSFDAAAV